MTIMPPGEGTASVPSDEEGSKILKFPGMSQQEARLDSTALLLAKFVEMTTGDRTLIEQSMEDLFKDPRRMGSAVLTLLNLCAQYASNSGKNMDGYKKLCDFLTAQIARDK